MLRVLWSSQAKSDLAGIDPSVRDQLVDGVEKTLRDAQRRISPADGGAAHGIMWYRGIAPASSLRQTDDPQNYFLFYRPLNPEGFEILAVRSIHQLASRWTQMNKESESGTYMPPL
jgi:hypothetical protein